MSAAVNGLISWLRGEHPAEARLRARFERPRRAVVNVRLLDMSVDQLAAMEARLLDSSAAAVESIEALEAEIKVAVEANNWPRVVALRARGVDQTRNFDELQELTRSVVDARMERKLQDAMAARLGSERRRVIYDAVMMFSIFAVIGILCVQEFSDISPETHRTLDWVDFGACCYFLTDFFWRLRLSSSSRWFWRRYWLDLITSIPLPTMYTLRIGRAVRLLRLLRVLRIARLLRIALFFWRGMDKLGAAFDVRLMRRSLALLAIVLALGSLGILFAEAHTEAEGVASFDQSLWWTFTTVVTGGYGDVHNPESVSGRLLTVGLVLAGMVVVGIFTATLTSLLVRENDESEAILSLEERVLGELADLRVDLERRWPAPEAALAPPADDA